MTDSFDTTPLSNETGHHCELAVGAGASIVVAVATSLVLALTLLVASFSSPAHAAEPAPPLAAVAMLDTMLGAVAPLVDNGVALAAHFAGATQVARYVIAPPVGPSAPLATIVVFAVLLGWLAVTADLWRALFNRVKSWDRLRS